MTYSNQNIFCQNSFSDIKSLMSDKINHSILKGIAVGGYSITLMASTIIDYLIISPLLIPLNLNYITHNILTLSAIKALDYYGFNNPESLYLEAKSYPSCIIGFTAGAATGIAINLGILTPISLAYDAKEAIMGNCLELQE